MPAAAGSSSEYNAGEHGCPRPTPAAKERLEWYLGRPGVGRDAVGEAFPGMLLAMLSQPCFDKTCKGRCGRPQQSAMKNSAWLQPRNAPTGRKAPQPARCPRYGLWPPRKCSRSTQESSRYYGIGILQLAA